MRTKRTQQLIAAVLAALLLASSARATPPNAPDKCECVDEAENMVCATDVGGQSVSPRTKKANFTIGLPGAGGWAPVLTYDGMHYNVQGGLGDLWEHSEGIWLEDVEEEPDELYLWANARRRHHF
ncbi:MAG: hypothetical protein HQ592_18445, partial [Planctomycetes bacterium]|nr:hypothetical protein [Planctomycetota bacterium]